MRGKIVLTKPAPVPAATLWWGRSIRYSPMARPDADGDRTSVRSLRPRKAIRGLRFFAGLAQFSGFRNNYRRQCKLHSCGGPWVRRRTCLPQAASKRALPVKTRQQNDGHDSIAAAQGVPSNVKNAPHHRREMAVRYRPGCIASGLRCRSLAAYCAAQSRYLRKPVRNAHYLPR